LKWVKKKIYKLKNMDASEWIVKRKSDLITNESKL
jgi:hypothetical protein